MTTKDIENAMSKLHKSVNQLDVDLSRRVQYVNDVMQIIQPRILRLLKYDVLKLNRKWLIKKTGANATEIAVYELLGGDWIPRNAEYIAEKLGADNFGCMLLEKIKQLTEHYDKLNKEDAHINELIKKEVGPSN